MKRTDFGSAAGHTGEGEGLEKVVRYQSVLVMTQNEYGRDKVGSIESFCDDLPHKDGESVVAEIVRFDPDCDKGKCFGNQFRFGGGIRQ